MSALTVAGPSTEGVILQPFGVLRCGKCHEPAREDLTCPTGHGTVTIPKDPSGARAALDTPAPTTAREPKRENRCARCDAVIPRVQGRPPKVCEPCLTPAELARRTATREYMRLKAETERALDAETH